MALRQSRRRRLLQGACSLASLGCAALPARAAIDPNAAFDAKSFSEALRALGGVPQPSAQIALDIPVLAENGAVVPITVSSALPGTREILILVDGNPQPVAARFAIPEGTEPFIATRIKLAVTGTVYAAVRTDSGMFAVARKVEVTVGGCG
jgi:sulfur-oxidizing protein SoxY